MTANAMLPTRKYREADTSTEFLRMMPVSYTHLGEVPFLMAMRLYAVQSFTAPNSPEGGI